MRLDDITKIELEITSGCNAACPGCLRTQQPDSYDAWGFGLAEFKRLFNGRQSVHGKIFKLCGVLGDPVWNPECLDIAEHIASHGGFCEISTNGGIRDVAFWERLGRISADTGNIEVRFAVDGHRQTNHIYRVNTVFDVIERNMQAYLDGGQGNARATWVYIEFDHNEHEVEIARDHARRLGFRFATRKGMRNSLSKWTAKIKKRNPDRQLIQEHVSITTTGDKEHSKKSQVLDLSAFVETYSNDPTAIDHQKKVEILGSMSCKLIHENEMFVASNLTLWPCCFLWDSWIGRQYGIREKLASYDQGWNDLRQHSVDEILAHEWFAEVLADSWEPTHVRHIARCIKTCAYKKAYQNEFNWQ